MTTLEQHLAAHEYTFGACGCGQEFEYDSRTLLSTIRDAHRAHVAATWREARTVRTAEELDALPAGSAIRSGECLMVMDRDKMWVPVWNGGPTSDAFLVLWTPEGGAV
ncbi:MAG: hypothetical protein WBA38_04185 [Gordonia sp. (in: high G+C Gram-positive bacteria)]|uniref:hypothetical protein n=1 Tax=Gordonia sp. (in: high G+C Gram-positive bacteria) TaxID=84139 RepID=UPI003C70DE60